MRLRRRLALALAATVTGLGALIATGTVPAQAVQPQPGVSDPGAAHYINEWNGNTDAGGTIRLYAPAGNEHWNFQAIDRCNSHWTVTHTCPFTVGSGMNDEYFGSEIDQIVYTPHETTCVGANTADASTVNRSCNNTLTGTGGGTGTVFISHCFTSPYFRCDEISLYYSNNQGTPRFLCSDSLSNGAFMHENYPPLSCGGSRVAQWVEWF